MLKMKGFRSSGNDNLDAVSIDRWAYSGDTAVEQNVLNMIGHRMSQHI
jgi:hypothetical protein